MRAAGQFAPPERQVAAELAAARQAEAALAYADAAGHYEAALAARAGRAPRSRPGRRTRRRAHVGRRATPPAARRAARRRRRRDRAEILLALGAAHDRAGCRAAGAGRVRRGRSSSRATRATRGCSPAPRSGPAASACSSPRRTPAVTRPLEEALARLPADERALAARLRARLAIEFYYPDRAGAEALSAQRSRTRARRATRPRSPPRSTRAASRCGRRSGSRSAWMPRPR